MMLALKAFPRHYRDEIQEQAEQLLEQHDIQRIVCFSIFFCSPLYNFSILQLSRAFRAAAERGELIAVSGHIRRPQLPNTPTIDEISCWSTLTGIQRRR